MIRRRNVLRGMLGGTAVTVGLPFLDCFLNTNGTALASGQALPVRFGTWTWGCGMTNSRFVPQTTGADYEIMPELKAIEPLKKKVSLFTGYNVQTDGRENKGHQTGPVTIRTGTAPSGTIYYERPTIDILISDVIGTDTRFRSLEMAATGNPEHSYSVRSASVVSPAVPSPAALYERVFGADFQDPNSGNFKPDPKIMVRNSVLSAVKEERDDFVKNLGAADQVRMDQYFTSVRQLEQQLDLQLQKPEPLVACSIPQQGEQLPPGTEITAVSHNHKLMAMILAHALACNQTKVFNMVFSDWTSSLRRQGSSETCHASTHNEPNDPKLGYPGRGLVVRRASYEWLGYVPRDIRQHPGGRRHPARQHDRVCPFGHSVCPRPHDRGRSHDGGGQRRRPSEDRPAHGGERRGRYAGGPHASTGDAGSGQPLGQRLDGNIEADHRDIGLNRRAVMNQRSRIFSNMAAHGRVSRIRLVLGAGVRG